VYVYIPDALCCGQFWTRYQTPEGNASLRAYADEVPRRRATGMAYAVNGTLDDSEDTFAFPLTREPTPLSLAAQCHGLLRANMPSMHLEDVEDRNATWLTLPLLRDMLDQGAEWRPLDRSNASTHSRLPRAQFVHKLLTRRARENMFELLVDDRLVPQDSRFCSHDSGARSLGGWRHACPCGSYVDANHTVCSIDRVVCDLSNALPVCLSVPCAATDGAAAAFVQYHVGAPSERCLEHVRAALRMHGHALTRAGFTCPSLMPANNHSGLDDVFFVRNGVSSMNREHVQRQLHTVLGEHQRTVDWVMSADDDTRVDNVLCERDLADLGSAREQRVAKLAFPRVSMVAEAPATAACLAFVMETAAGDILRYEAQQANVETRADVVRMLADSDELAARHHKRCNVQLARLRTCHEQGAYANTLLSHTHAQPPTDQCPHHVAPLAAGTVFVVRDSCLVVDNTHGEAHARLYDGFCVNASTDGLSSQVLDAAQSCRVADPRDLLAHGAGQPGVAALPALRRAFVLETLNAHAQADARTRGVLGARFGEDWLFPTLAQHPPQRASVPYWPPWWQGPPFGETLVDEASAAYGGGFSSYVAYVEDEHRFVVLPDHLRNATQRARLFGSAHYCRENTFALPMPVLNTYRVCVGPSSAPSSDEFTFSFETNKVCSDTAEIGLGGGAGDTIGDWWPLFRAAVAREAGGALAFSQNDTQVLAELERVIAEIESHHVAMPGPSVAEVFAQDCERGKSVMPENTPTGPRCYANSQCPPEQMCSSSEGVCVHVTVEVRNELVDAVEVGASSRTCAGQGKGGASPWELVDGLLHAHGLCAHANTVANEYIQELFASHQHTGVCTAPNSARWSCANGTEWHWVRQVPPVLDERFHPGMSTEEYEALGHEWDALKLRFLRLEPHLCDHDYIADSQELKMCKMSHVDAAGEHAQWMRTSAWRDETLELAQTTLVDERPIGDKLRFLGLLASEYYQLNLGNAPAMQTCRSLGFCGIQLISVGGIVHSQRWRDAYDEAVGKQLHSFGDLESCGAMGYPSTADNAKQCTLDRHVTALYHVVFFSDRSQDCRDVFAGFARGPFFLGSDGGIAYPQTRTGIQSARDTLNALFVQYSASVSEPEARYEAIHECALRVHTELVGYNTLPALYDGPARVSGLYYFFEYSAYEVPLLWWVKLMWHPLFYPEQPLLGIVGDQHAQVIPAFDTRKSIFALKIELQGDVAAHALRDIWAKSTLRAPHTVDDPARIVSNMVAFIIKQKLVGDDIQYRFACPKALRLKKYETQDNRTAAFENVAFAYEHQQHTGIDAAKDLVLKHVVPSKPGLAENQYSYETIATSYNGIVRQYEDGVWTDVFAVDNAGLTDSYKLADGEPLQDAIANLFEHDDMRLVSPFDAEEGLSTDHVWVSPAPERKVYVRVATFNLPAALNVNGDDIKDAVSDYATATEKDKATCFGSMQFAQVAPQAGAGRKCVFGPQLRSRRHEGERTGAYTMPDSNPQLTMTIQNTIAQESPITQSVSLCKPKSEFVDNQQRDCAHPSCGSAETGYSQARCSFHETWNPGSDPERDDVVHTDYSNTTEQKLDDVLQHPNSCRKQTAQSVRPSQPRLHSENDNYIALARAHLVNGQQPDTQTLCYRMDSKCLDPNPDSVFFNLNPLNKYIYDDVYRRVVQNANVGTPQQERYDAWYAQAGSVFGESAAADREFMQQEKPGLTDATQSRVLDVSVQQSFQNDVKLQKYTLNKEAFPDVTYAHLTTKDRVLYEVRRGTASQYVFGHATTVSDDRVLAAPVRSFCPRAGHSTEYMHHWKMYTPESNVRIDKPAFAAELRQTGVSVAGSQLRVDSSKAGNAVNVWQELQKFLHRKISFAPITENNNGYAACNHVNSYYESEFSEILRLRQYREKPTSQGKACSNCKWKGNEDLTKLFDGTYDENLYGTSWPWYGLGGTSLQVHDLPEPLFNLVADNRRLTLTQRDFCRSELQRLKGILDCHALDNRKEIDTHVYHNWPDYYQQAILIYDTCRPAWPAICYPEYYETLDQEAARANMIEAGVCENVRTPSFLLSKYTRYDRWEESTRGGWIEHDDDQPIKEQQDLDISIAEYYTFLNRSRQATMLDLPQHMLQDSGMVAPPCRVPRAGHDMNYVDLGACYEQDVHDTSNFENEPWWVESTCDMLRNFLDGKTHYNALRHWLDFRIPQYFSLSFLMHFFPDTEWIWRALFGYYPTAQIYLLDPNHQVEWKQNHDEIWTFDNYETFLSNHLSKTHENFGHVLANPDDRYWTENLVHLLMWFHVRDDSAHEYRANRNRLTACAGTLDSRAQNIHVIQSNDYGGHCKHGGSQKYVITKPTLWAEMDGTSGAHMVPCSPSEAQTTPNICESILKLWNPNPDPSEAEQRVVSFEVKLENGVRCEPPDTTGWGLNNNRVWVPVWGVSSNLGHDDSQALWKEVNCETYDPAEVVLPQGKTGCLGCGLYRFGPPAPGGRNVQFVSERETLAQLKTDVQDAYDDILSSSGSMLSRLQTALASLENDKYIIKNEAVGADAQMCPSTSAGGQCYSLWMQVDKEKAMDEQIDERLRATFTEFGQDQQGQQVCREDPEQSADCPFASFDANRARRASHALRMDIELNCQPPSVDKADLDSTVACASQIDGNASRLEELRNFVDGVYRHELGLGVPTVKLNTAAVLNFTESVQQRGHPSWEDGVHFFFADAERPGQQHLRRLLDRRRCRDSWGDTPVQERTCFKSQQERGTVATPWLGGNYSFPRVPYANLDFIQDIQPGQRELINLGFDMCTMEGAEQVEQVLSMNLPFARACHAVDCLHDATLNETRLTLCEQLAEAGILGLAPERELPELHIRGIVAPILRPESVLLTHAPNGQCKFPLQERARGAAPGARCTHTQAPLGFGVAQARGFAEPAADFSGARSMRARVKQHVLRMGRVPGLTGLWAGGSVLGEGVRADQFGYGLLARDPAQTGPHSIVLQVSSNAHMHVATVRLARNSTHAHPWVRDAHASVQTDIDLVLGSALYAPRSAAADAHWSCALTRAAAFALDEHFYARNPRLRLLTPDPVRMLDKYETAELDGVHPFVLTETLRNAVGGTTRAYARVGLGFFMPAVAAGERLALAQSVSAYLQTLHDHLGYGTSLNNQVHAPGTIRVPNVDWPWLPKTLRSGEKHGEPVHVDLGKLLPGYSSAIKADGALRPDYTQTTLERGGDCHRGHVAQFTRAELDELLMYDECHTASTDKLACTRAGSGATHEFSLRWHPRTVTRRELRRPHFRFPARRHALNHTLAYTVRASRAATPVAHELSVGRSERVSPLHAVLRRAASAGMALDSDVSTLWTRSLAARLDNAAWHARPGPAAVSADFDIGVRGSGCTARVNATRWAGGDRWGACVDAMSIGRCQVQNQVLDLCDIDELADMCAHLRQWRLDVARVNAAANGQVRVRARLYVPSAFESALGTFAGEIVQQTYKHHGAVCAYAEVDAAPLTSTTRCFAGEAIRLIDALKNLHDFAMQLMDMVFQYVRLQVQLAYVLCLSIMNAATGAKDTGAEFDTAISDFFTEVQAFISDVVALLPDLLNLVWILVQRTAGWIGIQEIMQAICIIIQVVSLIIHEIIVFLNRIPFVSDFFPDPAPYNTDICQFWRQPDYAADTHTYSTALLASHCLAATADISIPVDFWGSTYGSYSCHASSFCTRDGGALTDDTAILCGRCASGVYGCDMAVSRCRCGMRSEQRATPCFTAQDCTAAGAMCSVVVEIAASFGTAACADTQGLRTCLYESGAAHSGACAVLPARTEAEYTDCETAGEIVTAEQVLFGEWCLASDAPLAGSAPSVHEDQTFAVPCYLVSAGGAARRAKCAQVVFPQPARKWVVLAGDGMTRRRLLGAQAAPETELQLFAGANLARLSDQNATAGTPAGAQHFDCATVLAACAPELATVGCRACARVWWFWNLTLDSTLAGRDVHLLSPHAVVRACATTPDLRRMLAARGAQALTRVTRDWLQDQVAWRALQAGLNGAFSQLTNARVPKHAPPNTRRRLLQADAHAPPKTRRRLLQADTPMTGQAQYLQQYTDQLARLWDMQVAPPSRTAATAPAESTCSRSGVAIVDNILLRFSTTFKMRGYTARHECSADERAQASAETLECPLFEMPFRRWLREFTTLTQYYEHMQRTGCLQNSEVSCLPEPHTSFDSVSEAIPTLYAEPNEDGEFVIGSVANLDPFSSVIVYIMEFGLNTVKYFFDHPAHTFFGALSVQAYSDDVHYEALVRSNTWTIGRVAREFLTCDFENLTTCARVRSPLHITIAAVFCLLVLVHFFFPIHPVLSFFLWTLGLTVFVPFFAYGFSPLCFPRIPNCLTQDLYKLARAAVPARIMFPPDLVNAQTCSRGLVRVHNGQPDPMCVISCAASPVTRMHMTSAIFFTLEPMLTRGNVQITKNIVTFVHSIPFVNFDKHDALEMCRHYGYIFAYGTPEQQHAVMYCVGLNFYTLIATYVVLVLLLPVLIVLLQYIVLAFLTLLAVFTNFVTERGSLALMPNF